VQKILYIYLQVDAPTHNTDIHRAEKGQKRGEDRNRRRYYRRRRIEDLEWLEPNRKGEKGGGAIAATHLDPAPCPR